RSTPLEDQAGRRLPAGDGPGLEDPGRSAGLERLVETSAEAGLEMDEPAVLAGDPVPEAPAPPLIDLLGEDPAGGPGGNGDEDRRPGLVSGSRRGLARHRRAPRCTRSACALKA